MKINFPKIVREIDLSEYAPEIEGKVFVWVNPQSKMLIDLQQNFEILKKKDDKKATETFLKIFAELLSQGTDKEMHWTPEELNEMIEKTFETDPNFWIWLQNKVLETILNYRSGLKKD